jgi:hypothetical protein
MPLETEPEADEAPEDALAMLDPTAVKIVVLPVVLPAELVSALVVTADEDPPEPAPPMTVKRVVLPVVLPAELVSALVVMAEDEPPEPDPP